ncbi:MAG: efflux RND transporter periplasmic adaptor subunit [Nitrosomonadales bacterium]|nr:efflux RND transporter periplasmic adaptor subunit [Nitrosomonadales bacterium]
MKVMSQTESSAKPAIRTKQRKRIALAAILFIALAAGIWFWQAGSSTTKPKGAGVVQVVSAPITLADVSVRLTANGTVSAQQTVDVRPQISATIKAVRIKEGQFVRMGDQLFTLDSRTEEANLSKAEAQVLKDRSDLMNAERNLERQRELFRQEFISQSEFDAAQNQVNVSRGQLAVDLASVEASRVARSFDEITAPITGRTGGISVYPGSLVQPGTSSASGAVLVSITQIDPINVNFTLPERELAELQQAFAKGKVPVISKLDLPGQADLVGTLAFIDNAVDVASGTIRLKAEFPNADHRLWPGMFVTVALSPRTLVGALTVPAQAVQTGPEKKFLYVIGSDRKVESQPVSVRLIQDGIAVIEGVVPGARVVVEGAQNLRPGSVVAESEDITSDSAGVVGQPSRMASSSTRGLRTEDRQNKSATKPDSAGKQ